MGPFPHDAPPAAITPQNPMGTDGFAFLEFAHPEPLKLHRLFQLMGFAEAARHRTFALESDSPNRVAFNLERVMRTRYVIDDFQQIYFVISSFESLLKQCYQDFGRLYDRLATLEDLEPTELAAGDDVITKGTLQHSTLGHPS